MLTCSACFQPQWLQLFTVFWLRRCCHGIRRQQQPQYVLAVCLKGDVDQVQPRRKNPGDLAAKQSHLAIEESAHNITTGAQEVRHWFDLNAQCPVSLLCAALLWSLRTATSRATRPRSTPVPASKDGKDKGSGMAMHMDDYCTKKTWFLQAPTQASSHSCFDLHATSGLGENKICIKYAQH